MWKNTRSVIRKTQHINLQKKKKKLSITFKNDLNRTTYDDIFYSYGGYLIRMDRC